MVRMSVDLSRDTCSGAVGGSVMNREDETVKENAYRRDVRIIAGTSGCSNERLQCRNKPKGYQCGSWYDRVKPIMHSALTVEKSTYMEVAGESSRMAETVEGKI